VVSNTVVARLVEGRSLVVVVAHILQQEVVVDPTGLGLRLRLKQFPIVVLEAVEQRTVNPRLVVGLTAEAACCPIVKLLVL